MNITGIKKLAKEGKSPYFFSPDTMNFFNSKVYQDVRKVKEGYLFITSEVFGDDLRHYSLRLINSEGSIETLITKDNFKIIKQIMRAY
tara:strand:- start:1019 stop:1282 length:264 start_codon:yes stop_codon:yes gene_type:complete